MNIIRHITILLGNLRVTFTRRILSHKVQYHNPTLQNDPTAIWNYGFDTLDAIQLGNNVSVNAFAEIIVFKNIRYSSKKARLIIGDNSVISTGVNIRASGGVIEIGSGTGIGQYCVLVAANHIIYKDAPHINSQMDESKTDVIIGNNVWIGAGCYLLPGCRIGDNSVIGAGSVLSAEVPANEIWAGVPARRIKDLPTKGGA